MSLFLAACAVLCLAAAVLGWVGDRYEEQRQRRSEWRRP